MRVLVLEEVPRDAGATCGTLRANGFHVEVSAASETTLARLPARAVEIVVVGSSFDAGRGAAVCETLRSTGTKAAILVLTRSASPATRIAALDAGADDCLTEPVAERELLARLRALARRGGAGHPPVLQVGDLRLDPATHDVFRGGERVFLTLKEFSMLEVFMRRAGHAVSRDELLAHVWDGSYDNRSNVIDVMVSQLRRKLDEPFGRASFQTLRGIGYRLRAA